MLRLVALYSFAGLAGVWVLYPLTIAALAIVARRKAIRIAGGNESQPTVSVVIASCENQEAIRQRVADCLSVRYDTRKLDVVVGLDPQSGIADPKSLRLPTDRVTIVIGDEPGGKAATLNAAVRQARGEILVFTDTYQRFRPDAVEELVSAIRVSDVGAVSGYLDLGSASRGRSLVQWYWAYETWLRAREADVHSAVGVVGALWALRRSLWNPLPARLILDDVYTPMRLVLRGLRVAFAGRARILDIRVLGSGQEYRRKVRTLTGVVQLCCWLPSVLNPIRNPIWVQFVVHKLLRLLTPYLVLAIVLYGAVIALPWLANHALMVAMLVAAVCLALNTRPGVWPRVWKTFALGVTLQVAVIVATINGMRGRWEVWKN